MELTTTIIGSIAGIITAIISSSAYLRGKREYPKMTALQARDYIVSK